MRRCSFHEHLLGKQATHSPPLLELENSFLLPMKALGMVIFSHMRSRTSRPDSGEAMALTMVAMSLWMDR